MNFENIYKKFNESINLDFSDSELEEALNDEGIFLVSLTKKAEIFTNNIQNKFYQLEVGKDKHKKYNLDLTYSPSNYVLPEGRNQIKVNFGYIGKRPKLMGYAHDVRDIADIVGSRLISDRFTESLDDKTLNEYYLDLLKDMLVEKISKSSKPRLKCGYIDDNLYVTYTTEDKNFTESMVEISCGTFKPNEDLSFRIEYAFVATPKIIVADDSTIESTAETIVSDIEYLMDNGSEGFTKARNKEAVDF